MSYYWDNEGTNDGVTYYGDRRMNNLDMLMQQKMYKVALCESEKHIYQTAYKESGHNQAKTARLLGVARGTLISKLKNWRLI